jgi:hypothetical protein
MFVLPGARPSFLGMKGETCHVMGMNVNRLIAYQVQYSTRINPWQKGITVRWSLVLYSVLPSQSLHGQQVQVLYDYYPWMNDT